MDKKFHEAKKRGSIRVPREVERLIFFYATIAMFVFWGCTKLFGD